MRSEEYTTNGRVRKEKLQSVILSKDQVCRPYSVAVAARQLHSLPVFGEHLPPLFSVILSVLGFHGSPDEELLSECVNESLIHPPPGGSIT